MKQFIVALSLVVLVTLAASAQDDPLPDSVSQAYLAYENAMAAQDYVAASEAARAAWQAARDERIDAGLIGILAENYGNLALRRGLPEEAYPAWRSAAEISDRLRASQTERATRWYQASLSAFANGDIRDARQCSLRASRSVGGREDSVAPSLAGDIHYMVALSSGQLGRLRTMSGHAALALEAFEASGRSPDRVLANAHYLAGVGQYFEGERLDALYNFHISRSMFASVEAAGADTDNVRTTTAWIQLARGAATAEDRALVDARIAASAYPETGAHPSWSDREGANIYDVDAVVAGTRAQPRYPVRAAEAGIDGIVVVRFDVTESGRTDSATVVAAAPGGVFDDETLQAVASWRYEPAQIGGQAVRRVGLLTQFQFTMCELPTAWQCRMQSEAEAEADAE
ncbi:energy transducer TonB [Maricaulis salignorans]|uniref:Protein TonB n=1 Tax=Maricaulis salignorans TaxID=144026 RepID=A0A1G9PUF3_9PROT|nr:energy transducer TonB [Maricaulis salignorans]SDM02396.1 TonB family C-terminal domain-containing protein [Maricaulis salignorans]